MTIERPLGRMTIRERLMDLIARTFRDPPTCYHCGQTTRYRFVGRFWAWCCPNEARADHTTPMTEALAEHARRLSGFPGIEDDDSA